MTTVLIVDDDPVAQLLLAKHLESVGHRVQLAATGQGGLALAAAAGPDAILLDVQLPDCVGFDLVPEFEQVAPGVPVIIVTGHPAPEHAVRALQCGAFDYLSKAEVPALLTDRVAHAVQHRQLHIENSKLESQIEQNRRAITELEASRGQLQEFLDGSAQPIHSVNVEGQFQYVNRAWLQMLGYSSDEVDRLNILDILQPESRSSYQATMARLAAGSPKEVIQLALKSKAGSKIEVEGSVTATSTDDTPLATRWIFHDVTERNEAIRQLEWVRSEAERSARDATDELREVFRTTSGSFRIIDANFTVLRANETMAGLAGIPVKEMIGRKCFETFPGDDCGTDACTVRRIMSGEPIRTEEVAKRTVRGRAMICMLNARPLRVASGELAIVEEFHDLTETKRLQAIAESVSATENVGYVVSGIRHELGNPVNSVKTTIALVRKRLERGDHLESAALVEYLRRCDVDVTRMEFILRSLRSLNMFDHLDVQPVPLSRFLAEFKGLVERDLGEVSLQIGVPAKANPTVEADPNALHQVLLNLVTNAVDALQGCSDPSIGIDAEEVNGLVALTVRDNGRGMSERELADLFKPLHTNKPRGTGLGMTIVQRALGRMGGTIDVTSARGVGTRAVILLPRASSAQQEMP